MKIRKEAMLDVSFYKYIVEESVCIFKYVSRLFNLYCMEYR